MDTRKKRIHIHDTTLSYYDYDFDSSSGTVIFFLHGNSNSADLWLQQLTHPLLRKFRKIAFDLPGHGDSSSIGGNNTKYNVLDISIVMAAAVMQLSQGAPFFLVGFSLGSNILAEMLAHTIAPVGIVLISSTVVGQGITPAHLNIPGPAATVLYQDNPEEALFQRFLEESLIYSSQCSSSLERDFRIVKEGFRSSLAQSIPLMRYSDEIELLQDNGLPLLIIYGREDNITPPELLNHVELKLWRGKIHHIIRSGHYVMYDQSEQLTRLIADYTQDLIKEFPD